MLQSTAEVDLVQDDALFSETDEIYDDLHSCQLLLYRKEFMKMM